MNLCIYCYEKYTPNKNKACDECKKKVCYKCKKRPLHRLNGCFECNKKLCSLCHVWFSAKCKNCDRFNCDTCRENNYCSKIDAHM